MGELDPLSKVVSTQYKIERHLVFLYTNTNNIHYNKYITVKINTQIINDGVTIK